MHCCTGRKGGPEAQGASKERADNRQSDGEVYKPYWQPGGGGQLRGAGTPYLTTRIWHDTKTTQFAHFAVNPQQCMNKGKCEPMQKHLLAALQTQFAPGLGRLPIFPNKFANSLKCGCGLTLVCTIAAHPDRKPYVMTSAPPQAMAGTKTKSTQRPQQCGSWWTAASWEPKLLSWPQQCVMVDRPSMHAHRWSPSHRSSAELLHTG
eukprot:1146914-Pelagomonas_calceolata.AAC.26